MAKPTAKPNHRWAKGGLYVFWAVLGAFAVLMIAQYGYLISTSEAGLGFGDLYQMELEKERAAQGNAGQEFGALICSLFINAGYLVGGLTVLMIVSAGIVYATSQGQSGGEGSGIGLAKSMMIAALSGMALYVFGLALLGSPCGVAPSGGILQMLLGNFKF